MTQHIDLDVAIAELEKLAKAVGCDEWGTDTVKNEGEYGPGEDAVSGFDSYCVIDSKGNALLDTLNFDQSEIHEEYDEDSFHAWDEPARKVAEYVAAANPAVVEALIARLRKAEAASQWQPIETAPKDELVAVLWLDSDDAEHPERYDFDWLEDGCWAVHHENREHFLIAATPGSRGPSEKAPYTHWKKLGVPVAATSDSGREPEKCISCGVVAGGYHQQDCLYSGPVSADSAGSAE